MKTNGANKINSKSDWQVKAGLAVAICLTALGIFRYIGDMLTDASGTWFNALDGSFLRYMVRAPSDGTFWGDFNVQYFKLLAIPCGISGIFLIKRLLATHPNEAQFNWDRNWTRAYYIGLLMLAFTIMEIEKATHFFGLRMAGLLTGENPWLNHGLHLLSAILTWPYMSWLRFTPKKSLKLHKNRR